MLENANFLCEIGTEEIPAGYIPMAIEAIGNIMKEKLDEQRIDFNELEVYATSRRFAILISGLVEYQRSDNVELKGPSKEVAYDNEGNPSKALQGFVRGNGLSMDDVFLRETDKGEYIFAIKKLEAEGTDTIIPKLLEDLILHLPFPKRMRWSDKKLTFPRPIRYLTLLFNDEIIPFEIEGIKSGRLTRGHFVLHNEMCELKTISEYEKLLESNKVILDQNKRKEIIRESLHEAAIKAGGELYEDEALLDTVTYLVEYPNIIACEFNKDFLKIPDIVLIAEMKEHQKYFAVIDSKGKLLNKFLVISNNIVNDNIIRGNVKVISARFSDAEFFYREDAKLRLDERVDSLKTILFHKELGSIYDKIERMRTVGAVISDALNLLDGDKKKIDRAIYLSKTDLDTAMVYEFASLQGQIGRIYALRDGEMPEVADAINDHYRPRFHGDNIPSSIVSIVLSLSEKIDNLFGSFSVGNIPKGSQDPYALRRQSSAIVELLIRNGLNLQIVDVLTKISDNYKGGLSLVDKILDFINVRAKTIFIDEGFKYDEIDACMLKGNSDYLELFRRAKSLNSFRQDEKFSELLLGFKRMKNIVSNFRKDNQDYHLSFNEALIEEKEERDIYSFFNERESEISRLIDESKYVELFKLMIEAKSVIDSFFDSVLVMDKRIDVRDNRLYILEAVLSNFRGLIDFSRISDK